MKDEIKLIIDGKTIEKYNRFYFNKYSRRKKAPIDMPYHPSINKWMIMQRIMMNDLKQRWKEFIIWFSEDNGINNLNIEKCEMTFKSIFKTKRRHDVDNTVPKFILDGLAESKVIVDDDEKHLVKLILECGYDKENPRTEIYIKILGD